MSSPWLIRGRCRGTPLAVFATTLGVLRNSVTATSAAIAESAIGFDGVVAMSVPTPVVAGVPSTFTLTFTITPQAR